MPGHHQRPDFFNRPIEGHEEGMTRLVREGIKGGMTRIQFFRLCTRLCQTEEGRELKDAVRRARELTVEFFDPIYKDLHLKAPPLRKPQKNIAKPRLRRTVAH